MSQALLYALTGLVLFLLGLFALLCRRQLLAKILAANIMGSGVFLLLVALAGRDGSTPDPVPQAMVLTGIVVTVSATALALTLLVRHNREDKDA
jgi:multicomponent Na+:H+ antiporter subunit C